MSPLATFLTSLGQGITSVEEEHFSIFAQTIPSQSLGFVDSKATEVTITIHGRDLCIRQSPSLLSSEREGGTTGAVLWNVTPAFAGWISDPQGPLLRHGVLNKTTAVVELGCGIAGVNALMLAPLVGSYMLTDQAYTFKLLHQNLQQNRLVVRTRGPGPGASKDSKSGKDSNKSSREGKSRSKKGTNGHLDVIFGAIQAEMDSNITTRELDWETHDVTSLTNVQTPDFDVLVACDCIYNSALIAPFVSACEDTCLLREKRAGRGWCSGPGDNRAAAGGDGQGGNEFSGGVQNARIDGRNALVQEEDGGWEGAWSQSQEQEGGLPPTLCIIGQQRRSPEVFEEWLVAFSASFRCWRVPDEMLSPGLRSGSGYLVHVGILR